MKLLSEKRALERLAALRSEYSKQIREGYEHKAASCITCTTPGACCLDAHFVNVHISRLEAAAIRNTIDSLPLAKQTEIYDRVENSINTYELDGEGDTFKRAFSCPLFEKGAGCLVHHTAKPVPCITHACYENAADLPPDGLQAEQEERIDDLNTQTYGKPQQWLPLPLAVRRR